MIAAVHLPSSKSSLSFLKARLRGTCSRGQQVQKQGRALSWHALNVNPALSLHITDWDTTIQNPHEATFGFPSQWLILHPFAFVVCSGWFTVVMRRPEAQPMLSETLAPPSLHILTFIL